jgi:glycine C-acetyltransferase/8-amino-7-oxononanoate synthase
MTNLNDQLGAELEKLRADGLYRTLRTVASAQGPRVIIDGREFLNFSSNDYLGLANDPVLKRAGAAAMEKFGVGAGASRLVSGNLEPYRQLESKLARFKNKEAAIVFGSGYAANVGTITALAGEGDVVILDKLDHASIIDGARQSGATIRVYPHKNLKKLADILEQSQPLRRKLIVTETVFSMDGDLAPLAEIVELKEKYGAWLMIDEAHATGLYATNRRGIAEAAGVEDKIDVTLGTLSKALGCAGGFVVGSQTLIDFLRNRARSLIYSTALPPAIVAAGAAAVDFVMSDAGHQRRDKLWRNVSEMKSGLSKLGIQNESRSPIIPVIIGDENKAVEVSGKLYERGIFVPAIRFPTVPKGKARLRVTVTAGHREPDIERFLEVFGSVGAATFSPRLSHSAALRKGRTSISRECYFITTCTEDRKPVFQNPMAARIVAEALCWLRDEGRIRLLGFVLMPDHVHVALALRSRQESRSHEGLEGCGSDIPVATLAEVMKSLKGFTSRRLHQACGIEPPIWQDGYHDHLLRDRRDFENRLEYLHDNPRRLGLAKTAEEYPFSTAHADYRHEIDWNWLEGIPPSPGRGRNAAPAGTLADDKPR